MLRSLFCLLITSFLVGFSSPSWHWPEAEQRMTYLEKGTGDKHIILLHGFSASTFTWRNQVAMLEAQGYHVWAIDFLGFGESDKTCNLDYSIDLYRKQVLAFMKAKQIEQAHLVGHSMGGAVSLAFAITTPEKVSSLTLIDSAGYPVKKPLILNKYSGLLLMPFINQTTLRLVLSKIFYNKRLITEEIVAAYWKPLETCRGKNAAIKALGVLDNDVFKSNCAHYNKILLPTLIIWGEEDKLIPLSHFEHFKKDLPAAKVALIPSAGHAPQEESPSNLNPLLLQFLSNR